MPKQFSTIIGVFALFLCAGQCSRSQESYLTVQACLRDDVGVGQFFEVMREVATSEGLRFEDQTASSEKDLETVGANKLLKRQRALTINVAIEGSKGLGVTATNLGLPPNQVALGFTEGSDAAKAHEFSRRLVHELSQRWRVERVPKGKGAFPMRSC